MNNHIDLDRRFQLTTKISEDELSSFSYDRKKVTWHEVLENRFSIIVGRANFGKTEELKAKTRALRGEGKSAVYIALWEVLDEKDNFSDALEARERDAFDGWRQTGGALTVFVDSLDEASLGFKNGIKKALRRVVSEIGNAKPHIQWVFSSRPAILTPEVCKLIEGELGAIFFTNAEANDNNTSPVNPVFELNSISSPDKIKVFRLMPLDHSAAIRYLDIKYFNNADLAKEAIKSAGKYGIESLRDGPGGLDILAHIDLISKPPHCLTDIYEEIIGAVQQQQRTDARERDVASPRPEDMDQAIQRLACASVLCQLPNIEISSEALNYQANVLSARPILASYLTEPAIHYLLGSRLFIDTGGHQVKLYPDLLLPFLAAKHLAVLVKSPAHATSLLRNFTWRASTGECGVHRSMLPLAGWLSVFSSHCRHELLIIDPQAVAFFGDLRNPNVPLADAVRAIKGAIERLVTSGDSIGRGYYYLKSDDYWQAYKPSVESVLKEMFEQYNVNWSAKNALLHIASCAKSDVFRSAVLEEIKHNYTQLIERPLEFNYILALKQAADLKELNKALLVNPDGPEPQVASLISALGWSNLTAKSIAEIAAPKFCSSYGSNLGDAIEYNIAEKADEKNLCLLTKFLLLRLLKCNRQTLKGEKFVELVANLLAMVISRKAAKSQRIIRFCLAFSRFARKNLYGTVNLTKLQAAIKTNNEVRISFLKGLIHATDKSEFSIFDAIYSYAPIYQYVTGDEIEVGVAGFSELVRKINAPTKKPALQTKTHNPTPILNDENRNELLDILDGIRDASDETALIWLAEKLSQTTERNRYGEHDFEVFEAAAGTEISDAACIGLKRFWRSNGLIWTQNNNQNIEITGLQGLHLELGDGASLPSINEQEFRNAIRYAQFEINGFPKWFWPLVSSREYLATEEFKRILATTKEGPASIRKPEQLLQELHNASMTLQESLAEAAWNYVLEAVDIEARTTLAALRISAMCPHIFNQAIFEQEVKRRISDEFNSGDFSAGSSDRFMKESTENVAHGKEVITHNHAREYSKAVAWSIFWLWQFPESFERWWKEWHANAPQIAIRFMIEMAACQYRNWGFYQVAEMSSSNLKSLGALYRCSQIAVKKEDDILHDDGQFYSPVQRDDAQRLRDSLVGVITHIKTEQAYAVLEELKISADPLEVIHLKRAQFNLREEQTPFRPIPQKDYPTFERDLAPEISDYQSFALAVEADLLQVKRDIEEGDFSLRRFFNSINFERIKTDQDGLALEADFQALLGSELNHAAKNRYAVTLEPTLPDNTRRDLLCEQNSMRATIELKMSQRWTLPDYVEALKMQLQGQYMKAQNSKIGFLVIVLQKRREWKGPDGEMIEFEELIEILQRKARDNEIADSKLYLRVIAIDATQPDSFRKNRPPKAKSQKPKAKSQSKLRSKLRTPNP